MCLEVLVRCGWGWILMYLDRSMRGARRSKCEI